jgi:hypothetical protein
MDFPYCKWGCVYAFMPLLGEGPQDSRFRKISPPHKRREEEASGEGASEQALKLQGSSSCHLQHSLRELQECAPLQIHITSPMLDNLQNMPGEGCSGSLGSCTARQPANFVWGLFWRVWNVPYRSSMQYYHRMHWAERKSCKKPSKAISRPSIVL